MNAAQITSASTAASDIFGGNDNTSALPKQSLGQDEFLRLLITQMSSQDPLNPLSNSDFIAQMAQFSALEQSRTMQVDMAAMRSQQEILQANSLIGREVDLLTNDGLAHGTVSGVQITQGVPQVIVNDTPYDLSEVITIAPPAPQT